MADSIEVMRDALIRIAMGEHNAQKIADDAIAASRALSPAGGDWVMVPREPTVEMLDAMNRVQERHNGRIYAAGIAASPQQEPGADGLRDAISASLYELSLVSEGREHDEAVAHIEKRITSGQTLAGAGGTLVAGSRGKYLYLPGVSIKSAAPPKSGAVPFDVLSIASEMEAACPHYAGPDVDYSVDASKVHTWAQALRATQPATSAGTTGDDSEDAARNGCDAERHEDMSQSGRLRLIAQDDGDMGIMVIEDDGTSATVEFCASGGRSPLTLQALRDLSRAMQADAARRAREVGDG